MQNQRIKLSPSLEGNTFSQWGEEVAVEQLITHLESELDLKNHLLVEFGASRGKDNSNFFKFRGRLGLVLIEGDNSRFQELSVTVQSDPNVFPIKAWVGSDVDSNNLECILSREGIPSAKVFGVSIDIDSDDAAVFEAMGIQPMFAIVEFNPTLPADARYRNPTGLAIGNSALEILEIGHSLGYFLAAVTPTNLIMIHNSLDGLVAKVSLLEELKKNEFPRYGWGYDGTLVRYTTSGKDTTRELYHNGWNQSFIHQPAPNYLRGYKDNVIRRTTRIFTGLLSSLIGIGPINLLRELIKR